MRPPHHAQAHAWLADALLRCDEPGLRDRILLEAVLSLGVAGAAEIWRTTPGEDGEPGAGPGFHPVLSRGHVQALPAPEEVRAVIDGHLGPELPPRRLVLAPRLGGQDLVLALGDVCDDEDLLDLVESLLVVSSAAGAGDRSATGATPVGGLMPLLPFRWPDGSPRDAKQTSPDHERLLRGVHARLGGEPAAAADAEDRDSLGILRGVVGAERASFEARGLELDLRIDAGAETISPAIAGPDLAQVVHELLVRTRDGLVGWRGRVEVACRADRGPRPGLVLRIEAGGGSCDDPRREVSERVFRGGVLRVLAVPNGGVRFELWLPAAGSEGGPFSPMR